MGWTIPFFLPSASLLLGVSGLVHRYAVGNAPAVGWIMQPSLYSGMCFLFKFDSINISNVSHKNKKIHTEV